MATNEKGLLALRSSWRWDPERVVIAESSEFVRALASTALEIQGYRPLTATTGVEALGLVYSERPGIVLLESELEEPDGWSVLGTLKSDPALAGIRVVLMTDD